MGDPMSWTDVEEFALELPCPACGAQPDRWCVTYRPTVHAPGRFTTALHQPRTDLVWRVWMAARKEGGADALEAVAYALQCRREGQWWTERDGIPFINGGEPVEAWLRERAESHRQHGY